jgi:SAM-dependent methyltransferase
MTIKMKWDKIYTNSDYENTQVATVLAAHQSLLPKKGCGLDLACGLGGNALLLAEQGLETYALDISSVALNKLQQQARQRNLIVHCQQQDVENIPLAKNKFDVIVVSRFLNRDLSCEIINALKLKGLLFYQTFTQAKINKTPPNNPNYLLAENELLRLFSPLKIRYYQEYALVGEQNEGNRDEALFIGQKI